MAERLMKAYEITEAKITFVSLVDKAANKKPFLITKRLEDRALFTTYGKIVKRDAENHYVTGIVYEPMAEDAHGNYMTAKEIEKAAFWFYKNGQQTDLQHSFQPLDGAAVVESWIAKADFSLGGQQVRKGTWLMTIEVADPDVWEAIEKGEITGLSMGGTGIYSEEDTNLEHTDTSTETVEKAGRAMSGKNLEALAGIRDSLTAFLDGLAPQGPEEAEGDGAATGGGEDIKKEEGTDMSEDSEHSSVEKASSGAQEAAGAQAGVTEGQESAGFRLTPESVQEMVAEAVEKALAPTREPESTITAEQVQAMIDAAVEKAVEPILKMRGLPSNLDSTPVEKQEEQHYLHGFL